MATRSIVTSQPDVACDVCMRRLLRGERPDVFLAGGRRLTVCELCAPRAAHEGWLRERDAHEVKLAPARARRGRGLLARLRGRSEPSGPHSVVGTPAAAGTITEPSASPAEMVVDGFEPAAFGPVTPEPFDFTGGQVLANGHTHLVAAEHAEEVVSLVAEPVNGVLVPVAEPAERDLSSAEGADSHEQAAEPATEEGSWRDAWMFVTE